MWAFNSVADHTASLSITEKKAEYLLIMTETASIKDFTHPTCCISW